MCIALAESGSRSVGARGGELFLFSDQRIRIDLDHYHSLTLADVCPSTAPIIYMVTLHLRDYHAAVRKGANVDHSTYLAKSVTVE